MEEGRRISFTWTQDDNEAAGGLPGCESLKTVCRYNTAVSRQMLAIVRRVRSSAPEPPSEGDMSAGAVIPVGSIGAVSVVGESAYDLDGWLRSVCSITSPRRMSSRTLRHPFCASLVFHCASWAVSAIARRASSGQPVSLSMRRSSWSLLAAAQ